MMTFFFHSRPKPAAREWRFFSTGANYPKKLLLAALHRMKLRHSQIELHSRSGTLNRFSDVSLNCRTFFFSRSPVAPRFQHNEPPRPLAAGGSKRAHPRRGV